MGAVFQTIKEPAKLMFQFSFPFTMCQPTYILSFGFGRVSLQLPLITQTNTYRLFYRLNRAPKKGAYPRSQNKEALSNNCIRRMSSCPLQSEPTVYLRIPSTEASLRVPPLPSKQAFRH